MFTAAPFDGPHQLVARSKRQILDLMASVEAIEKELKYYFLEGETEGKLTTYYLQFSEAPSYNISLSLREAINNLRTSLDILICDCARVTGTYTEINKVKYPFAKSETTLRKLMNEMAIHQDIVNVLTITHPLFIKPNAYIRDLHELDIEAKHRSIISTYTYGRGHPPFRLSDNVNAAAISLGFDFNNSSMLWSHGSILMIQADHDPHSYVNFKGPLQLSLVGGLPFAHEPILIRLDIIADRLANLIDMFFHLFSPDGNQSIRDEIRAKTGLP